MADMFPFTGIKDIDCISLLNIADEVTLTSICLSCRYANDLCNNYFWMKRIEYKFGVVLSTPYTGYRTGYKPLYKKLIKMPKDHILEYGAKKGLLELVIYAMGHNPHSKDLNNALVIACSASSNNNNLHIISYLLENGAHIHYKYHMVLFNAVASGNLELVIYLIEKGASINNDCGVLLKEAAYYGKLNIVKYLLEKYMEINKYGGEALLEACRRYNLDVIKYLIESGVDINYGRGALITVIEYNDDNYNYNYNDNLDVVKYLVENGANIHYDDDCAIRVSARHGNLDVVKYLVERGVNIRSIEVELIIAVCRYGRLELLNYLVEQGVDCNINSSVGVSIAAERGHLNVVKYLVEHGADIYTENEDMAIEGACAMCRLDVVEYLLLVGNYNPPFLKTLFNKFKDNTDPKIKNLIKNKISSLKK